MTEGGMNALPDEIISHILSWMPIKEAAKTSILSTRWKCLWKFTRRLEFNERDIQVTPQEIIIWDKLYHWMNPMTPEPNEKLISYVDRVLDSIQSPTIDEFRICFNKYYFCRECIERWIIYAIERGVKRLAMDLTHRPRKYHPMQGCYPFPLRIFSHSRFGSFTELSLAYINISGEAIEHILSKCLLLARLSILHSNALVSLKVSSFKLKCLSIRNCWELKSVELLDAANLESFTCKYRAFETSFTVKNIPRLIELSCVTAGNIADKLSYLPMLETLKLRLPLRTTIERLVGIFKSPPILYNVKYLELKSSLLYFSNLLCFTPLLKACPLLRTFRFLEYTTGYTPIKKDRVEVEVQNHGYKCLKIVEYIGYDGSPTSFEFLKHLIENSEMLKKVILDPYPPASPPDDMEIVNRQIDRTRQHARELEPKLPPGIEFVIL